MDTKSISEREIVRGYSERVSSWMSAIYLLTPFERDRIRAIPMMPMEPAKAVRSVRIFLVRKLLKESPNAVRKDIEERPIFLCSAIISCSG